MTNDEEQEVSEGDVSEEVSEHAPDNVADQDIQEESPEDIIALIDGIESALAADSSHLASASENTVDAASPHVAEDDLPAALRPARVPEGLSSDPRGGAFSDSARRVPLSSRPGAEAPAAHSSVRPTGYASRADSFPPPRRLEPVPMPRRVHLDSAPRSAGPIPRVFGSTRDVLAKFRWGA